MELHLKEYACRCPEREGYGTKYVTILR